MRKVCFNILTCIILILTVAMYIGVSFAVQLLFDTPPVIASTISDIVMAVLCGIGYIFFRRKGIIQEIPPDKKDWFWKYILLFVFLAFALLTIFSWININFTDPTIVERGKSIQKSDITYYIITSVSIVPFAEEIMMRLFLYNFVKSRSSWLVSMIVTSIVFALLHGTISHLIIGTVFAVFMVFAYENTGKWYMSILGHTIYNLMAVFCDSAIGLFASLTPIVIMIILVVLVLMLQQMTEMIRRHKS